MWGFLCVLVVALVTCGAFLAVTATRAGRLDRLVRKELRRRCVVTCKNDDVFTGVLFDADDRAVVLVDAVTPAGDKVDGQLLILRADVAFVQLL